MNYDHHTNLLADSVKRPVAQSTGAQMGTFQVTCHKPDNADKDRRLQGVGGSGGGGWYRTVDQMISLIDGGDKFWTVDQDRNSVWIIVASRNSRKYIKTTSDGLEPNNLLALPHCP